MDTSATPLCALACFMVSRRAVVSREAKKQQAHTYSGQCDHYSELFTYMDGRCNFLKCCSSAAITAIS